MDIFNLLHSPKSIGSCQNQFLWHFDSGFAGPKPSYKRIRNEDGDWDELVNELGEFLRFYIPPHKLVNVSIFEDAHPNTNKGINAVVTHFAGENPKIQQVVDYELE